MDDPQKRKRGRPRKALQNDPVPEGQDGKGTAVAADLGNSTTTVAYRNADEQVICLPDPDGMDCTPSVVAFQQGDPDKPLFGRAALNYRRMHPEYVSVFAKRARGSQRDVPVLIDKDGKAWLAEDVEGLLLQWRLRYAEQQIGEPIKGVLVTVPANFSDPQRRATMAVVDKAGYAPIGTVNEPSAALLCYALGKEGTFAVLDVGGGTIDITIVRVTNGTDFAVLASEARCDRGGKEVTALLQQHAMDYAAKNGAVFDPAEDLRDLILLENEAETAKYNLSSCQEAMLAFGAKKRLFNLTVTRSQLDELARDLCQDIASLVHEGLKCANLTPDQIDGVALVGGASRTPCIRAVAESIFGADKLRCDVDADRAVALGAVEAIALKIQERVESGDCKLVGEVHDYLLRGDVTLQDVCGVPLGIRAFDPRSGKDVLAAVINKGMPLPASQTRYFDLEYGDISEVSISIEVLQGKAGEDADKARVLATFPLDNLPAGTSKKRIRVTFSIDSNGVCEVHALDTVSGREIKQKVDAGTSITKGALK